MAIITDYGTLKTAVADYLARSDLTTFVPNFIQNAEAALNRDLRLRFMETSFSDTIAANGTWTLPASYLEMKRVAVSSSGYEIPLIRLTPEQLYSRYPLRSADGMPSTFCRDGSVLRFGPHPDSQYTISGTYYARPARLSDSNTSNWWVTDAPDLLLYGALLDAEAFLQNDPRLETWGLLYKRALNSVVSESGGEEGSGATPMETVE